MPGPQDAPMSVSRLREVVLARPRTTRWLLAGPGALLSALLVIAAMPVWLPAGSAGVDNIVYPLLLAPLIWAVLFSYVLIEENLLRGTAIALGLIASQGLILAIRMSGPV